MESGFDKWETQVRKGTVQLAILAALWNGKLYGLEILRVLKKDSDLVIAEGTIYPLLTRLKSEGLVDSEWVESEAGHPRKYYQLTNAGRYRTQEMARLWSTFAISLNGLLASIISEEP